jgi:hypothetical protein
MSLLKVLLKSNSIPYLSSTVHSATGFHEVLLIDVDELLDRLLVSSADLISIVKIVDRVAVVLYFLKP